MLAIPYVTVAAFRAHPTFMDTLNLRSGDSNAADQDDELNEMLLKASMMADNYLEFGTASGVGGRVAGTLSAHSVTENARCRIRRDGTISYHPKHHPVQTVTAFSFGYTTTALTPMTDLTGQWIEDDRQVVMPLSFAAALSGLQFGTPLVASEVYTTWTYTAGYVNTQLSATATSGATSISVLDATGVVAGSQIRIWDPGHEEIVTIASTYTTGLSLPLVSPIAATHTVSAGAGGQIGVSGLPGDVHLAVILYACALLMRPDTSKEDVFPAARITPNTRKGSEGDDGSGFVEEAERLLENYRRVVH